MEQVVIGQFWLGSRAFQSYKPNYAKTRFDKLLLLISALYCQYSLIIQGQSLDSTNSRGAPPSCSICRSWYLGLWCPFRAWWPPSPHGSRPGREARQGRKVNTWGSLRPRVDWSLSGAICNIFFYHYFFFNLQN